MENVELETSVCDPADLETLRAEFGDPGAPLGWDAVRAFEAEYGVVLPEPYRTFIAEISDGSFLGPPESGMPGLGELPSDWGEGRPAPVLSEPFPLTEAWIWKGDERPGEEYENAHDAVFERGSLVLGTDGCGMYWHLIVTGPHRGHVWNVSGEGAYPFGVQFGTTTGRAGFAGWVRHWVECKEWYDIES